MSGTYGTYNKAVIKTGSTSGEECVSSSDDTGGDAEESVKVRCGLHELKLSKDQVASYLSGSNCWSQRPHGRIGGSNTHSSFFPN